MPALLGPPTLLGFVRSDGEASPWRGAREAGWQRGIHVYAIIQARGRQLKVSPGSVIEVDGTAGEQGKEFTFEQVLLVEKDAGDIVAGAPFVANAKVLGIVDGESRGPKLRVFKKKRRKGFRKTRGHRSTFTRVRITEIQI